MSRRYYRRRNNGNDLIAIIVAIGSLSIISFLYKILSNYGIQFMKMILWIVIAFLLYKLIRYIIRITKENIYNKRYNVVFKNSIRKKLVRELNDQYIFDPISKTEFKFIEKEFSRKNWERIEPKEIIEYHIENNKDGIRDAIEAAINNKKLYTSYINELKMIPTDAVSDETLKEINMKKEVFNIIDNDVVENVKYNEDVYELDVELEIPYYSYGKRTSKVKNEKFKYDELYEIYKTWEKNKKYRQTSTIERHYMNNELRYDVLKRDNFKCVKCGATAKDGVKLHVDHIIPIAKGGKTTMSNLQTLCERCNLGKGTKEN